MVVDESQVPPALSEPAMEVGQPSAPSVPNPGVAENGRRAAGGWVRRSYPTAAHECRPPSRPEPWAFADGQPGDLWRCACGRLWRCGESTWFPASWWQRWRYRRRP